MLKEHAESALLCLLLTFHWLVAWKQEPHQGWKASSSSFLWVEAVLSWNVQQKEELTSFPLLLKPAVFLEIAFESRDKGGGMPSLSNVSWNSEFANYKNFYSPSTRLWVPNWELGILPGQQNEGFALSLSFTNAVVHTACILSLIELFGYFMLLKAVAPAFHIRLEPFANYVCLFNIIHNFHASWNFACSRLHYQVWPLRLPRPKTVNEFIEGQEHSSEARSC